MSANNNPVGFAIVGLGSIADFHAQAIEHASGAKLTAVYSRSREKRDKFAAEHKTAACSSLEELLARPDVEVVMIATPSGAHSETAIPAMKAGKHILCEKPLEVTVEKIDDILRTARETDRIAGAIFQSRFGNTARALKGAIDAGRFGQLTLCSTQMRWWRSQEYYSSSKWKGTWALDGGGALMNQGIHAIDLLQWLVGMPSEVSAYIGTLGHEGVEVEDNAAAILKYPSGALGIIEGSTACYPGTARRLEISGTDGHVTLEDDNVVHWDFRHAKPEDEEIKKPKQSALGGGSSDPRAISFTGHQMQVEDMARAIRSGGKVAISVEEGRNAVQLICGIYESAKSGKPVKL